MKRRLLAAVTGLTFFGALVMPAATAEQADRFSATIVPSAVQPLAFGNYAVQVTNRPQSAITANNAHVAVPGGFVVDAASLSATTTAAGTCSAGSWTAGLSAGGAIDAVAPDAPSELCPGGTLTISFAATAPAVEGTSTWTTTLFHDTTGLSLQAPQPVVDVDGTPPPPPTLTAEPSDPSDSANPSFSFSDSDGTATFSCQLDGGPTMACASPTTYSGLGEGQHAFAVTAIDPAGNVSSPTSYSWTIDLTPPPAPTISSAPPGATGSTNASFSFSDDEAGAGLRCKLDSGNFGSCTSPVNYGGLSEGTHTFSVKAVDAAGNESSVSSYSWTIDLTPPTAPTITSSPPSVSASTSATFSFTDADSTATFRCRLDGSAFSSCTSPVTYDQLAEGSHTFRVKAVDPVGNESAVTTDNWTIDATPPPAPTITTVPASVTSSTTATFAFTDGDSTATFRCRLDFGGFTTCTSPTTYQQLGEGTHTFRVKAVDPAGNESTVSSYTWTVDVTPPPAPAITPPFPPNVTDSTDATFAFSDGDGSASFRCRLDGAGFSSCTSPAAYHALADGAHTFQVKAIDPAGNESTVTSYTWTIDLTNPVVAIDSASKPLDPTNQTSASFVFTSNKANSTFQCRLDGAAFAACASPATYTALSDARHSFGVRATDQLGHQGLATVYEWTVDTVPPHATITSGPAAVSASPGATFEFSSSETATFSCSLDGGAFSACSSPEVYVGLVDGSHTFEVRGTDLVGNADATPASYAWQVVTPQGPDTTPPGPVQALRRIVGYRLLKLEWSLPTDPDLAYVRVTRSRSSKGAAQAVVYQGTATTYSEVRFQNGQYYRYEIQAYDTSGNPSSLARVVVPPSALLRSPRDGSLVKAPPLLLWAGVARATYYNVQVYRGAHKVLSAWPARAKLKMRSRWVYKGSSYRLRKGGYRWWVWPAFGPRSKGAYGQLLGTGTFVVR